jgi:tetratricopeptide (TPR) repeat protein
MIYHGNFGIRVLSFYTLFFGFLGNLNSLTWEDTWVYLRKSEIRIDKDPGQTSETFSRFGIFSGINQPRLPSPETVAFQLHSFCFTYFRKFYPNENQPEFRAGIETLVWETYFPQVWNLRSGSPKFYCKPRQLETRTEKRQDFMVSFRLDTEIGFVPYEWKKFQNGNLRELWYSEYKRLKPDTFVKYHPTKTVLGQPCIVEFTQDTNGSGRPDLFSIYRDCKLIRTEEDYNENGVVERICHYKGNEVIDYCEGIGEKTSSAAKEAKSRGNWKEYISLLQKANSEYLSEFGPRSRHVCPNHFEILIYYYEKELYEKVLDEFQELKENQYCKKEELEANFYTGYVNLHIKSNYEAGIRQYEIANKLYKEEYGWDSIDINFQLAYGYLTKTEYQSCLRSLDRIKRRPFNPRGRYFYNYYRGACETGEGNFEEGVYHLRIALDQNPSQEERSFVLWRLGLAFQAIGSEPGTADQYFQAALRLNPKLQDRIPVSRGKK